MRAPMGARDPLLRTWTGWKSTCWRSRLRTLTPIRDFIAGIRLCLAFESPAEVGSPGQKLRKGLKMAWLVATKGRAMQRG
jgi:hypothetical protein